MPDVRAGLAVSRYLYLKALRRVQPLAYGTAMRLRALGRDDEIEAIAPFDSRILYQHTPLGGDDGFLFHRDHDALEQLSATIVLRRRQIDVWVEALEARLAWCKSHGAAMRFLVIPEKHVVYEDKLPRFTRVSRRRPAMQLFGALDEPVRRRTLYPLKELKAASRIKPTYFKTDTHWNAYGAFVAYSTLIESLREEIALETIREDELAWKERPFVGDLGVRYAREQGETRASLVPNAAHKLVFQNNNFGRGAIHVYENERRDLPTCVLFRDSFSSFLIPYLMHGFSSIVAVSSLSCHYDLLEKLKPDVVLFVAIERFLATFGRGRTIELPEDAARQSFFSFSGTRPDEIAPGFMVFQGSFDAFGPGRMPPLVFGTADDPPPDRHTPPETSTSTHRPRFCREGDARLRR